MTAALAVVVLVLVEVFVLGAKHQPGSVPGRFYYAGYKEGELTRRGVFDKTKWH